MRIMACLALAAFPGALAAAEPVTGSWVTAGRDGVVEIAPCGPAICGRLARFLVVPPGGPGQRDVNNPNPSLRARRVLGMPILTGFKPDGNVWRGTIYDPKSGKSYRSVLKRTGPERIEVKGCVGPFCQTQIWRKAN